jgi:hypothetical protein
MTARLTPDLQKALRDSGEQPPEFVEPETGTIYVLIAKEQLVTREDVVSIQRGIDQLNAGQGRPIRESKADLARQLGFNPPQ